MQKLVAFRIDEKTVQHLRQMAAARSLDGLNMINVSVLVREAVTDFLAKHEKEIPKNK